MCNFFLLVIICLICCCSEGPFVMPSEVQSFNDLPDCQDDRENNPIFVRDEQKYYECKTVGWHEIKKCEQCSSSSTTDLDSILSSSSIDMSGIIDGTFLDSRDGKAYPVIVIGNQLWFAQNLDYLTDSSWCYDDLLENCQKYGRLYQWQIAIQICPAGWHVPTIEEWETLELNTGYSEMRDPFCSLIDKGSWSKDNYNSNCSFSTSSGLNVLPGGYRSYYGSYLEEGWLTSFWSTSISQSMSFGYEDKFVGIFSVVGGQRSSAFRDDDNAQNAFYVRCIKTR